MPSDANGVYSLPAGYLAVTGLTIQPSQHNPPLEDIQAAITGRLAVNGANPMTGQLRVIDGAVGAPGIAFNTALNTGFYRTANGFGVTIAGTKVAEFTAGGIASGARFLGELIPYSGSTAPALTVFPVGQTLLRATYPALWTYAQTEIAAGSIFYNNGDGSTTFGIADLRGRVVAGKDNMGGVAAGRLGSGSGMGGTPTILGFAGGFETHTLTLGQAPTGIASGGSNLITVSTNFGDVVRGSGSSVTGGGAVSGVGGASFSTVGSTGTNTIAVVSSNTGGGAHNNVQPTILANFLLFAGA